MSAARRAVFSSSNHNFAAQTMVGGIIDWEAAKEAGQFREIEHNGDAFKPDFELFTDEHNDWVRNVKAKFEPAQ